MLLGVSLHQPLCKSLMIAQTYLVVWGKGKFVSPTFDAHLAIVGRIFDFLLMIAQE
jgi:hypothetical protein